MAHEYRQATALGPKERPLHAGPGRASSKQELANASNSCRKVVLIARKQCGGLHSERSPAGAGLKSEWQEEQAVRLLPFSKQSRSGGRRWAFGGSVITELCRYQERHESPIGCRSARLFGAVGVHDKNLTVLLERVVVERASSRKP